MAETNDIFEEKGKHLVGKIITSNVTGGRIANIDLPISEDFANILVIDANDLKTEGYINVLDNRVPVFAQDHVSFKGQPILAVFAHDMESVELYAKEIKISYQISPEKESSQVTTIGKPFVWSYGRPEEYFNGTNSKIGSSFYVKSYPATILGDQDFFAFTGSDGKVYLKVPTQWPINLKENVARVIGKSKSQVIVNTDSVYAPNDQFVIEPTILASIAATAAMKSGEPVILKTPISTWQPKTEFLFETSVGKDGSTPATRVHCTVDLGAFPIFREEVCYNILAGVVPPYPVKAMEVSIVVQSSNT
ncbi:MAG: molybdopterin-dependent oxidoreductase, partial [Sphaerochaetaceae bacterium]|nr:molybdopterin-dependent oxidoreductase [Sphaerochaetaceae bacterium]